MVVMLGCLGTLAGKKVWTCTAQTVLFCFIVLFSNIFEYIQSSTFSWSTHRYGNHWLMPPKGEPIIANDHHLTIYT